MSIGTDIDAKQTASLKCRKKLREVQLCRSLVELDLQPLSLRLVTLVLAEVEGVEQVQRNRMRQKRATRFVPEHTFHVTLEWREHTRLATPHVVSALAWAFAHRGLGIELEDANGQDNLQLGFVGKVLPELRRADTGRAQLVAGHLPRKVDAVRVDDVAHKPSHRDASVLDLGVAQEANGRLVGLAPELRVREVEGIVESDSWVEILRQRLQVSLALATNRKGRDGSKGDLQINLHIKELKFE